jgi:FtsZ-binding cell division protein ZapB
MTEENMNVELPDEDIELEEAHDEKNAEAQSVASVDAADDKVKKAPARKGDQTKQDPAPKTKAGMLNAMYGKLSAMKKTDLHAMYGKMMGEEIEVEEEAIEESQYDFSTELHSLVESEATLSDEFKAKAAVIFEAAIRSKITEEVDRLEDEYQSKLEEELTETRDDLVEKVDNYLNYVVEQWMKENELAVEQGIRTEIAEGFMGKLKELFVESYIEVPESKIDLVDELASEVDELEEKLNSSTEAMLEMSSQLEELQRDAVVREHARDLADTEAEKLRSLVSSLDFEDADDFGQKVKTVKEAYFKKEAVTSEADAIIEESAEDDAQTVEVSDVMSRYLSAMKSINN